MERSGRIGVFLQVRINSTRLPGKAMLKLDSSTTVIGCALGQLKKVNADIHALLTDVKSMKILEKEAEKYGFSVFTGSEDDVLSRFTDAARFYNIKTIIRATGDNPFVFYEKAQKILDSHIVKGVDHSWFESMPLGSGVEVVEASALYEAERCTDAGYDREHVTPFVYNHPELFDLNHQLSEPDSLYKEGRITLDTMNDYNYLKKAAAELTVDNACDHIKLIEWLRENKHPDGE